MIKHVGNFGYLDILWRSIGENKRKEKLWRPRRWSSARVLASLWAVKGWLCPPGPLYAYGPRCTNKNSSFKWRRGKERIKGHDRRRFCAISSDISFAFIQHFQHFERKRGDHRPWCHLMVNLGMLQVTIKWPLNRGGNNTILEIQSWGGDCFVQVWRIWDLSEIGFCRISSRGMLSYQEFLCLVRWYFEKYISFVEHY